MATTTDWMGMSAQRAPQSYAVAEGVTGNPLLGLFGKAASGVPKEGADRAHNTRIDTLASIFTDGRKSQELADLFLGLTAIDADYLITYVAPLRPFDGMQKHWKIFRFNKPIADPVPHLGVSRVIKHGVSQGSVTMVRHGISMTFEHDFLTHEEGVRMWINSVRQTQLIVQRTLYFDVIVALLESGQEEKKWIAMHGLENFDREGLMAREVSQYAWIRKYFELLRRE